MSPRQVETYIETIAALQQPPRLATSPSYTTTPLVSHHPPAAVASPTNTSCLETIYVVATTSHPLGLVIGC